MSPEQIHILLEVAQRAQAAGRGGKEPIYAKACQKLNWSRATLMRRLKDVTVTTPRKRRSDAGTTSLSLPDAHELSTAMMEGSAFIDLYYETYDESVMSAVIPVNVYVLDDETAAKYKEQNDAILAADTVVGR